MQRRSGSHSPAVLRAVAIFKLAKGLLLIAAGIGALKLIHADISDLFTGLSERVNLDAHPRVTEAVVTKLFNLQPKKLEVFGAGSFAYGALFLVEGVGLWLEKRWAEYVTIVSTAGFIPLEVYELTKRFDATRIVVFIINVAILVYLIWRVKSERRGEATPKRPARGLKWPRPAGAST